MSQAARAQRIGEWLIHADCRRLPADVRAERCQEWTAELPAILADQGIRLPFLRTLRVLTFCIGISRAARQLSRPARGGSRRARNSQWRTGATRAQTPNVAVRTVVGLAVWLVIVFGFVNLMRAHPDVHGWPLMLGLALAVSFDAFCLVDIARAAHVRYLPKWAWALICLIQTPGGGIMYLSLGHVGRSRPVPPGDAKP
jgi:hypothetical protein